MGDKHPNHPPQQGQDLTNTLPPWLLKVSWIILSFETQITETVGYLIRFGDWRMRLRSHIVMCWWWRNVISMWLTGRGRANRAGETAETENTEPQPSFTTAREGRVDAGAPLEFPFFTSSFYAGMGFAEWEWKCHSLETLESGNWGKRHFPSGQVSQLVRPLQDWKGSQWVWGQFPVRSPQMHSTHQSLNW